MNPKNLIRAAILAAALPVAAHAGVPGDVDGSCGSAPEYRQECVNLADAITAARILTGQYVSHVNPGADVNGDGVIGVQELVYLTRALSQDHLSFMDTSLPGASEGNPYEAHIRCTGPDIDIEGNPAWLSVTYAGAGNMSLSGTPAYSEVNHNEHGTGRQYEIKAVCRDGDNVLEKIFTFEVTDADRKIRREEL